MSLGLIVGIFFLVALCIAFWYIWSHNPERIRRRNRVIDDE